MYDTFLTIGSNTHFIQNLFFKLSVYLIYYAQFYNFINRSTLLLSIYSIHKTKLIDRVCSGIDFMVYTVVSMLVNFSIMFYDIKRLKLRL